MLSWDIEDIVCNQDNYIEEIDKNSIEDVEGYKTDWIEDEIVKIVPNPLVVPVDNDHYIFGHLLFKSHNDVSLPFYTHSKEYGMTHLTRILAYSGIERTVWASLDFVSAKRLGEALNVNINGRHQSDPLKKIFAYILFLSDRNDDFILKNHYR